METANPYEGLDLLVIANPVAGQPEPVLAPLAQVFGEHELAWQVAVTRKDLRPPSSREAALAAGVRTIVSYGGDGTVNEIANVLKGTDAVMGIVPGGHGQRLGHRARPPRRRRGCRARHRRAGPRDGGRTWARRSARAASPRCSCCGSERGSRRASRSTRSREDKDRLGYLRLREAEAPAPGRIVFEPVEWTVTTGRDRAAAPWGQCRDRQCGEDGLRRSSTSTTRSSP